MQRVNLDDYVNSADHIATFSAALDELMAKNLIQQPADDKQY